MKITLSIISIIISVLSVAQPIEEDIGNALDEDGLTFMRFDTKNSFIANSRVKIYGINIGYNHNNTVKYGIGFHATDSKFKRTFYEKENNELVEIPTHLNFVYISLFGEYVFYQTKRWEGSLPIQLGFGGTSFSGVYNDSSYVYHEKFTIHYEATLNGHYRFLKYFSIGGGLGYRIMIIDNKQLGLQLTNPIYTIKFKFYIGDLYRDTKALFVHND